MKSVLIITQSVYDTDPRVRRKAEALIAAGYRVDVLALQAAEGGRRYTVRGVDVRAFPLRKKRASRARYAFEYVAFFVWCLAAGAILMARRKYAVVDVNTLPDFLIFAAAPAKWMGARLVLDMHEITPEFYMSKYGLPATSPGVRLLTFVERVSMAFADRVITINDPIHDLLVSRGLLPSKAAIVMNAVDESRFAAWRGTRPEPGADGRTFAFIYHGTLTRIYGLDLAIEAFAMAHTGMPDAELWILGSGPERDALAGQAARLGIARKVKIAGQVPPSDIPEWLGRSSVGLLPIRRDVFLDFAFPNKLPEFVVVGKPVLVSRLKAINRYFTDAAVAYFEPGDAGDLAKQMQRIYGDDEWRAGLAARARDEYTPIRWDVARQRYLDVIEEAARHRSGIPVTPGGERAVAVGDAQ